MSAGLSSSLLIRFDSAVHLIMFIFKFTVLALLLIVFTLNLKSAINQSNALIDCQECSLAQYAKSLSSQKHHTVAIKLSNERFELFKFEKLAAVYLFEYVLNVLWILTVPMVTLTGLVFNWFVATSMALVLQLVLVTAKFSIKLVGWDSVDMDTNSWYYWFEIELLMNVAFLTALMVLVFLLISRERRVNYSPNSN